MERRTFDILVAAGGLFLAVTLIASGVLLTWAHTFIGNEVHTQLAAQQIYFPPATARRSPAPSSPRCGSTAASGSPPARRPRSTPTTSSPTTSGIGDGKTYAQLSAAAIAQPECTELAAQVATVFKGGTLRGLLLNAYAFGTMGMIAGITAITAFIAGTVMLVFVAPRPDARPPHLPDGRGPLRAPGTPAPGTSPARANGREPSNADLAAAPAPPVPVPHDNPRRGTPAGSCPSCRDARLAGHTVAAAVVMHHARLREPAGTALRVWRRLHPTEPSQRPRAASPAARELVPDYANAVN